MSVTSSPSAGIDRASKLYAPYLEATWGLKNHWYPALFGDELAEGELKAVTICGHDIALRRAKGRVYALADRCAHRGVRISAKPMCLTDEHLMCWYHGFTYGLDDGVLKTIVASPNDPQIGRVRIRTYPVNEVNAMIYVFVGDEEYQPLPPLEADLPMRVTDDPMGHPIKHPNDPGIWMRGVHRTVKSNWRLGAENGFDPGHVLIHRDNQWIVATDDAMPLGYEPIGADAIRVVDEPNGPKGVLNRYEPGLYRPVTENTVANIRVYGKAHSYARVSVFLPGVVMVEHRPLPEWGFYEWFVPIDDVRHEYWSVLIAPSNTDEERAWADFKYENFLVPLALGDFNDHDIFAREQMQDFYGRMNGFARENLCKLDGIVIAWRKLVSQFNRGIQDPPASCEV